MSDKPTVTSRGRLLAMHIQGNEKLWKENESLRKQLAEARTRVIEELAHDAEASEGRTEVYTDIVYGGSGRKVSVATWIRSHHTPSQEPA